MNARDRRFSPPPCLWPGQRFSAPAQAGRAVQRVVSFAPLRTPGAAGHLPPGEQLVHLQGNEFLVRDAARSLCSKPSGTYNFVRVQGSTPKDARTLVSPRRSHASLAEGHPVIYAGTARFDAGTLDWWSNYSGSYQPIAAFRHQAQLPEDRFVPWQRLQMGGIAMQRGMLTDRRPAGGLKTSAPVGDAKAAVAAKKADRSAEPAKAEAVRAGSAEVKNSRR